MTEAVDRRLAKGQSKEHFAVLLNWDVRTYWKEVIDKTDDSPGYPYAYGFNHAWFVTPAGERPVLWVISSPDYGKKKQYRLPPTLIARLQIKLVRRGEGKRKSPRSVEHFNWVAVADCDETEPTERLPSSVYLRVNNALTLVLETAFIDRFGHKKYVPTEATPSRTNNPYSHIPSQFQGPRRIDPDDVPKFENHARRVHSGRTVFVSYNHEHRDYVEDLRRHLESRDFAPWIDFALVPKPNQGAHYEAKQLTDMIEDGVRQAGVFLAIGGDRYSKSDWTRRELRAAEKGSIVLANLLGETNPMLDQLLEKAGAEVVSGLSAAGFADLARARWRDGGTG